MPQIRRIRIVNINYNNGKRLIPDELFDLTDENSRKGLNTLISLINGGGKSVLVQLMMQPVLPRAHASSRRIEEFFTRSGDHGFIMLEWMLDNSNTRLLTGIAIAAAETSDESRGRSIKYYTFCSTYTQDSANYSIINLELSRSEGSRYVPAEYDYVRKLATRSGGELRCFSDRENPEWKGFLEQYGISQEQWRTLTEKLNSSENGMTGYFEKFKTSDQLIDQLLIPAIEAHLSQTDTTGESELSAMMLGYLEQYRNSEKRIHERDVCQRFTEAMLENQKAVQLLWKAEDAHNHAVGELFGFQAAVTAKCAALQKQIDTLSQQQAEAETQLHRIDWEDASECFWKAKELAEQTAGDCQRSHKATSECEASIEIQRRKSKLMKAAKYAARSCAAKNKIEAITVQIQEKEQDSDAQQLTVLGGSIHCILETELPAFEHTAKQQQKECDDARDALQQAKVRESEAERAAQDSRTVCDKAEGALLQYQQETDSRVRELKLDIQRNFTECYASDEVKKIIAAQAAVLQEMTAAKENLDAKMQAASDRIAAIPEERAEFTLSLKESQQQMKTLQEELADYQQAEEQLKLIFALHSLEFTQRFSSAAADLIAGSLHEEESKKRQAERRLEQKNDEITAANTGSLHIPQTVQHWLDQTAVQYQTCESYLLNCELTAGQVTTLLQECPAAAYGILVSEREKQLLLQAERPDWLPAVLPVFTYDEINAVLQHDVAGNNLLAHYARGYFTDHTSFIEVLSAEKEKISGQIDTIGSIIERLKSELKTVLSFQYQYDESWLSRKNGEIAEKTADIQNAQRQITALNSEDAKLKQLQETLSGQIEESRKTISSQTRFLEELQKLEGRLAEEEQLYDAYESARKTADERSKELQAAHQFTEKCSRNLTDAETIWQSSSTLLLKMQQAQTETQAYTSETIIAGDWQSLYQQFQTLCKTQDDSILVLRTALEAAQDKMKEAQSELRKTEVQPEEYADIVYSEQAEKESADELEHLEELRTKLHEAEIRCANLDGKAQTAFEQAQQRLDAYGEPLAPHQISGDHARRRANANDQIKKLKKQIAETEKQHNVFSGLSGRTEDALREMTMPETISPIHLDEYHKQQWKQLCQKESDLKKQLSELHQSELKQLYSLLEQFNDEAEAKAINVMIGLMQQDVSKGDRYFTLDLVIEKSVKSTTLRACQIAAELNDFDNTRQDLVRQCVLQGQQIYHGLQTIMKNSRIQTYEGTRKDMLKMDLPKEIDETLAADEIAAEIDRTAQEIIARLEQGEQTEAELKQKAEEAVSSRHLLRKYIRKENIELQAYKVDANRGHAEYRRWKDIPRTNSGAEKFLVYFAIVVLLMDYSGNEASIQSAEHTNVLILDNPFAVITSAHVLSPMFRMAEQFRIQLICLSDITKCDITNCFDLHIKAAVRQNILSDVNILSHEGNEKLEHGFYRAKQMELS